MTASNEEGGSLVFFDTTELIKRRKLGTPGHAPSSERLHKWCHLMLRHRGTWYFGFEWAQESIGQDLKV